MSRKQAKNWKKGAAPGGKKFAPARDARVAAQNAASAADNAEEESRDSESGASDSVDGFADGRAGAPATRSTAGGCLYLVGTPIGNLEDMTLRGVRILKEVSQIACEDTRHTAKLLQHYGIEKPLVSYHEHNEMTRAAELVVALEQGAKIALVSDAGMPLVSDPGHRLVAMCLRHHIAVVPIPGPSALLAALSASGLPNEEFLFVGFLPARSGERRRALERLRIEDRTIIFYEAPHRIAETIADAFEVLGDRPACLAREVTKLHEEFRRGRLSELTASLEERPARGEITLLIGAEDAAEARARANADSTQSLSERVDELIRQAKLDRKDALKLAAKERGLSRRAAYGLLLEALGKTDAE
jgi:16S rRNA (cytidine1402-2'-O)-methyltransferase